VRSATCDPRIRPRSLYFPGVSGNPPQRRVRSSLHPPPPSLLLQRLPAGARAGREKSPRLRGVLGVETWRSRTGDGGLRGWKRRRTAFVSVARLGGSDSLWIRLVGAGIRFSLAAGLMLRRLGARSAMLGESLSPLARNLGSGGVSGRNSDLGLPPLHRDCRPSMSRRRDGIPGAAEALTVTVDHGRG